MRQNRLDMIEDGTFDSVQDLEWIDLGRNQLTSVTSELFAKNENLRIVDLGNFAVNVNTLIQSGSGGHKLFEVEVSSFW